MAIIYLNNIMKWKGCKMSDQNISISESIEPQEFVDITQNLSINTQYGTIHFVFVDILLGRRIWSCQKKYADINSRTHIYEPGKEFGVIKPDPTKRQYCFHPNADSFYSAHSLRIIAEFIGMLNNTHSF